MVLTLKVVMMIHVNNASVGTAILSVDPKLVAQLIVSILYNVCVARNVLIVNILGENAQMEMYFKILQKNATNVYVVMET